MLPVQSYQINEWYHSLSAEQRKQRARSVLSQLWKMREIDVRTRQCRLVLILTLQLVFGMQCAQAAPQPGAVVLDGQQIFVVYTKLGSYSLQARAARIMKKLNTLVQDPDFKPETISSSDGVTETDIVAGDVVITSITDADAFKAGMKRQDLANQTVDELRGALQLHLAKKTWRVPCNAPHQRLSGIRFSAGCLSRQQFNLPLPAPACL